MNPALFLESQVYGNLARLNVPNGSMLPEVPFSLAITIWCAAFIRHR